MALSVATMSLVIAPAAHADSGFSDVRNALTNLGVDAATQDTIIANLIQGVLPESDLPGSVPASETTTTLNGFQTQRFVYADGSVKETQVQIASNPKLRGLSGCSTSSGTGYTSYIGCSVTNVTALVTMGYLATFTIVQGGYNDYIYSVSNPLATCRLGACSNYDLRIPKPQETTSGDAWAMFTVLYTLYSGLGSSNYSLTLNVGHNTYSVVG